MIKEELKTVYDNIYYFVGFCGHNKNLTKKQYEKLDETKNILEKLIERV